MIENFVIIYPCLMLVQIIIFVTDLVCRFKANNKYGSVRNSFTLTVIVFAATFVAEFAFLSNFYNGSFSILFGSTYLVSVVSFWIICREKIIYNSDTGDITAYTKFKKFKFNVDDITRINSSNEYLDIYLGDKRIRYGNLLVTGEHEFVLFVKKQDRK